MMKRLIEQAGKGLAVLVLAAVATGLLPTLTFASDQRVDALLHSDDGPWTATLVGFDLTKVKSVTYYLRDGTERWHQIGPVKHAPFEANVEWWRWDTSNDIALTARVVVSGAGLFGSDGEVADPGGWHWISRKHLNPGGSVAIRMNPDGSAAGKYKPDRQISVIRGVDFWLRDAKQHWTKAGSTSQNVNGVFSVSKLDGTTRPDWKGSDVAVSVHVIWLADRELVDPAPWTWADHFAAAPTVPPAVGPTKPTPTPTPAPAQAPAATSGCEPTDETDVFVRYITPQLPATAQRLGAHVITTCEDTVSFLERTSPEGTGYCTQVALARDNPGYDENASPAPPLRKVMVAVGGGC